MLRNGNIVAVENKTQKYARSRPKGFARSSLYKHKEPHAMHYLSQRLTFWIAVMSVFAFVTGNMMGQMGWHVFWKSVLGNYDDSLIVYDGTVTPIAVVPDYTLWSTYGGNSEANTFRQVPRDVLIPMPHYTVSDQRKSYEQSPVGDPYSIGHMGSYDTGAEGDGSHVGIDIRVPESTPIRSIMNGIIVAVKDDPGGFGKYVVIRHPRVPDPSAPTKVTNLYSSYAHLSSTLVSEGVIVKKGETIGLSGATGNASGPHLHFQMDREEAPWHPYWAFSWSEMREAGMSFSEAIDRGLHQERGYQYTVNPMLYIQANYDAVPGVVAVSSRSSDRQLTRQEITKLRRHERLTSRMTRATVSSSSVTTVVVRQETVVSAVTPAVMPPPPLPAHGNTTAGSFFFDIRHDGSFTGREWETVRITLVDETGRELMANPPDDVYLRTAYGSADFDPPALSPLDFDGGSAVLRMLPRGQRTVVIQLQPSGSMSQPMKYQQ